MDSETGSCSTKVIMDPLDTSDHYPIHADVLITPDRATSPILEPAKPRNSKSWAKVDLNKYKDLLEEQLASPSLPPPLPEKEEKLTIIMPSLCSHTCSSPATSSPATRQTNFNLHKKSEPPAWLYFPRIESWRPINIMISMHG